MAAPKLKYGIGNSASTTFGSGITASDTSAPLTSDTNFQAKSGEGMAIFDEGAATEELAYSTGLSGGALTIPLANRGLEGGSAQAHSAQSSVKGPITVGMWNDLIDALLNVLSQSSGALDATKVADLTTAQTFTNKTLTSPKVGTSVLDTNGNELVKVTATSSAVNELTLANAATGTSPTISATGGDSVVGLDLKMKSTGRFRRPTIVELPIGSASASLATGDGQAFFRVPEELNGMNLTGVAACVYTAGTTNTLDVQIRNKTQTADMLTTKITIDSGETDTSTAATAAVIDTGNDDVATADVLAIDIDAVHTTPAKGLLVQMRFELP